MSELKFKVGDKEYDIPIVDTDTVVKILEKQAKHVKEQEGKPLNLLSTDGIEQTKELYHDILNPYYPELTKKVIGKMPFYQCGDEYVGLFIVELQRIPLGSKKEEESQ